MTAIPRGHRMSPLDHSIEGLDYAIRKSGLSQAEFADQIGKSQGYISEIRKGTRNANPALLLKMAQVLNCPVVVLEAKRDVRGAA